MSSWRRSRQREEELRPLSRPSSSRYSRLDQAPSRRASRPRPSDDEEVGEGFEGDLESDDDDEGESKHFCKRLGLIVDCHDGQGCFSSEISNKYFTYLCKWVAPAFAFLVAFMFQNYCLHISTYFYIQWMYRLEDSIPDNATDVSHTITGDKLSSAVAQGSLHDVSAAFFGRHPIPMATFDYISGAIPVLWLCLIVHSLNLQLFTKGCVCGCLLALGKGFLAVVTVLPDSIGWEQCKARLGKDGLAWFKDKANMNFKKDAVSSLQHLFYMQFWPGEVYGLKMRYCADMVYSGHTYAATLFALGLYDFCKMKTRTLDSNATKFQIRTLVGAVLSAIVLADGVMMLLNHFHYTLDIVLAVLLVFLYYTNAAIARTAIWWADEKWVRHGQCLRIKWILQDDDRGDLLIPPCCFPFCCIFGGRYGIMKHSGEATWHRAIHYHIMHLALHNRNKFNKFMEETREFHSNPPEKALRLHRHEKEEFDLCCGLMHAVLDNKGADDDVVLEDLLHALNHPGGSQARSSCWGSA